MQHVDQVNFNEKDRGSINYAKCREAIKLDAMEIAKGNQARAINWTKDKLETIASHLKGTIVNGKKGIYVEFPDGSKAKFQ